MEESRTSTSASADLLGIVLFRVVREFGHPNSGTTEPINARKTVPAYEIDAFTVALTTILADRELPPRSRILKSEIASAAESRAKGV